MEQCPICNSEIEYSILESKDTYVVNCPRCGEYLIPQKELRRIRRIDCTDRQRANISGWLQDNQGIEIDSGKIEELRCLRTPSFHERADRLLLAIAHDTEYAGQEFYEFNEHWISCAWCIQENKINELRELIVFLDDSQKISFHFSSLTVDTGTIESITIKILPDGWLRVEELEKINQESKQGFVAMWFDPQMDHVYENAISKAITAAGYQSHRVDQREHTNKIDDEIIAQIRRSRFVVADFTGHRSGVYYEAGFAKGLGLEVFWTCREDDLDNLHFDIRQYNCLVWKKDELDDFARRLQFRIESVLGEGGSK